MHVYNWIVPNTKLAGTEETLKNVPIFSKAVVEAIVARSSLVLSDISFVFLQPVKTLFGS